MRESKSGRNIADSRGLLEQTASVGISQDDRRNRTWFNHSAPSRPLDALHAWILRISSANDEACGSAVQGEAAAL